MSYGVYVVSVKSDGKYAAAIVTWLTQVTFKPQQIMLALEADGRLYAKVEKEMVFAVNIPDSGQKKLAASFLKRCHVEGGTINGFPFFEGKSGAPYFEGCTFYLECKVRHIFELGDHELVIAEVVDSREGEGTIPLTLKDTGWKYGG